MSVDGLEIAFAESGELGGAAIAAALDVEDTGVELSAGLDQSQSQAQAQAIAEQAAGAANIDPQISRSSSIRKEKRKRSADDDVQYLDNGDMKERIGRYVLENDNYNYIFNYPPQIATNLCLSIGSCRFFPFEDVPSFDYLKYRNFLDKAVSIYSQKGTIFSLSNNDDDLNPMDVLNTEWDNYQSIEDPKREILKLWKSFKNYRKPIEPEYFELRYNQSLKVQGNESYSVLTFGQFQQLYGFFMTYTVRNGKGWKTLPKFKNYIHHNTLVCPYQEGDEKCQAECHFYVDCLHRVVITKFLGGHLSTCSAKNKEKCFFAYRSLILSSPTSCTLKQSFEYVKEKYSNCYESCIINLGVKPSYDQLHNWKVHIHGKSLVGSKTADELLDSSADIDMIVSERAKWITFQIDKLVNGDYPVAVKDTLTKAVQKMITEKFPDIVSQDKIE